MAPVRGQRVQQKGVDEMDVIPYARATAHLIGPYYSLYSDELCPLANFKTIPENLFVVPKSNGDIILQTSDAEEATFDVIAMIIGLCLEAPPGFPKSKLPFFRRWIKVTAIDEPFFAAAVDASEVLYNFMSMSVPNVRPPPRFSAGGTRCFRPSADMLTSLENSPGSAPVDIPPLYNQAPITDAIRAGHGNYVFSSENEVSFFGDEDTPNGDVLRREICPNVIQVGQIAQIRMSLRLLRQENGTFTYRELLKGVYVLHAGSSMEISRKLASQSLNNQRRPRDVKFYAIARKNVQVSTPEVEIAEAEN